MSRDYCTPGPPFLYTGGEPGSGMDCLHPQLRHPHLQHLHHHHSGAGIGSNVVGGGGGGGGSGPGPFHHLIHEQAKSLVALQELQHEVGALLEFRDLVIETFPSLRTKMAAAAVAAAAAASTPATMMLMSGGSSGGSASNIPVAIRRSEWEPGIQVRRKLITSSGSSSKDAKKSESTIQDSGFSTETSSKETHSSAASANSSSQAGAGGSSSDTDHSDDELWNLLDVIHRKGMRLRDEVEALQGTLQNQSNFREENDFQRFLFHGSADDLRVLRLERDHLLDRLSSMEAEVLASRLHTSRLQEDFEQLLVAKMDLEDQLQSVLNQRGQVNSRIHDLHVQFVADVTRQMVTDSSTVVRISEKDQTVPSDPTASSAVTRRTNSSSGLVPISDASPLDLVLGDSVPKVKLTDSSKVEAILMEKNLLVLQKHLLTSTVKNQVLQEQLQTVSKHEEGLADKLDKARVENDELKFQLKDKHIELEGTLARVRMLELHTRIAPASNPFPTSIPKSPDIIPQSEQSITSSSVLGDRDRSLHSRTEITTPSMKAMSPYPPLLLQGLDHSSSTESAHDHQQQQEQHGKDMQNSRSAGLTRRKPSKIPLVKSHPAPKPPGNNSTAPHSTATTPRSRSGGDTPVASRTPAPPTWRIKTTNQQQPPPSLTKSAGSLYSGNKSRPASLTKDSVISTHSSSGGARTQYRKTTSPGVRRANTTASNGDIAAKVPHTSPARSPYPWTRSLCSPRYFLSTPPEPLSYLDSLDQPAPLNKLSPSTTMHNYYDSIDTSELLVISNIINCNSAEFNAETDSLEKDTSIKSGKQ